MLAGCSSSTLLSPRHTNRLRSEPHFPSMSTQRLDLSSSCASNFPRKDSSRAQSVGPVGLETNPIEARTVGCGLKHNVAEKRSDLWESSSRGLKRLQDDDQDESFRAKRKRGCQKVEEFCQNDESLTLGQFGNANFWFQNDQERVCFGPSNVISPPLRTNNPWMNVEIGSIVNETTDFGEKSCRNRPVATEGSSGSGSGSTSPESQQILDLVGVHEAAVEHDAGIGTSNPNQGSDLLAVGDESHEENVGFELISLLSACLEAIGFKNVAMIHHFISKLGELASPRGGSPLTRLAAYYTEALALRVSRLWPNIFHVSTPRELNQAEDDNGTALILLNQATPIPKFVHFTSNAIFLRAFEGKDRVHIIDFDIKQGLQWPSFFQSLALRNTPLSHVRITGVGESKQDLIETGERLSGFANALNLPFEFHPVVDRLEDVRLWMLHVKEQETVAVNCIFQLHKMLYDGTGGALRDFLGLIRSTNPRIVVTGEQESEHNEPVLEKRVSNSLKYYSAIFDSVDSVLAPESPSRVKIEESFGREIRNIVACEGLERHERHVGFDRWWSLMEQGGFRSVEIDESEFLQSQMLLKMYGSSSYKVEKKHKPRVSTSVIAGSSSGSDSDSGITLNWLDQPLYTVSAWVPSEIVGSSSSYQQLPRGD